MSRRYSASDMRVKVLHEAVAACSGDVDVVWRLAQLVIGIAAQRQAGHDAPHCDCKDCTEAVAPALDLVDARMPEPERKALAHEFACAVKGLTDFILVRLTRPQARTGAPVSRCRCGCDVLERLTSEGARVVLSADPVLVAVEVEGVVQLMRGHRVHTCRTRKETREMRLP